MPDTLNFCSAKEVLSYKQLATFQTTSAEHVVLSSSLSSTASGSLKAATVLSAPFGISFISTGAVISISFLFSLQFTVKSSLDTEYSVLVDSSTKDATTRNTFVFPEYAAE